MNKIKKLKILGTIIAFLFCFPFHFVYTKYKNVITGIFFPVNESIWEHMKILFGSIILSGVIQKIISKTKKLNINNICISNFIAAVSSIPIFLIIFLPIYKFIGENLLISIVIMLISIILSEIISYIIMKKNDLKKENLAIVLVIIVYIIFTILTYIPPKNILFLDPIDRTYGIKKIK